MMIIGLTGGIASGKSVVSKYLADQGYPVVDADKISREVVLPGTVGLRRLTDAFGQSILLENELNRKALGKIVFSDKVQLERLNSILHPLIHESILKRLLDLEKSHELIIFDAPLLLENNLDAMVDSIWLVSCEEATQLNRVIKRDGLSEEEAQNIISKQMPLLEKVKRAHVILRNDTTLDALYKQIDEKLETIR